jgi:hypothetical protein
MVFIIIHVPVLNAYSVALGVYLTLYFVSIRVFLTSAQSTRSRKVFYISFGGVLVFLNTIVFASMPLLGQLMWIVHRDEVDPLMYYEENSLKAWYVIAGSLAQTATNFLADALLVSSFIYFCLWHITYHVA